MDLSHREESIIIYRRKGRKAADDLLVVLNLAPLPRFDWEIDTGTKIYKEEIFNSDASSYFGSGSVFNPSVRRKTVNKDEKKYKTIVNIPPLAGIILK